ncbi:MAG: hypothetical protein ACXIUO_03425 [Erythrobacter sp.]
MEKPTIWSSRPDALGRTVRHDNSLSRRAQYGRIRPMEEPSGFRGLIARILPLT